MTNQQLLLRFRLGFTKIIDKNSNTTYRATKELANKVLTMKTNIVMMFFVVPIPILFLYPANLIFKIVFGFFLYLFEAITLFAIGRVLIKEKDLMYVEKENTRERV